MAKVITVSVFFAAPSLRWVFRRGSLICVFFDSQDQFIQQQQQQFLLAQAAAMAQQQAHEAAMALASVPEPVRKVSEKADWLYIGRRVERVMICLLRLLFQFST